MLKFEHFENVHLKCTPGHPRFQIPKYATVYHDQHCIHGPIS